MNLQQYIRSRDLFTTSGKRGISFPSRSLLIPIAGIVVSESFLFFGFTWYALAGHLLTLVGCVLAPLRFDHDLPMLQVFALVPVFRLVNLGMPVFFELTIYWFPLIYGPLIPAIYLIGKAENPISLSAGWKAALLALPLAVPFSAALGAVEYSIIEPPALIPSGSVVDLLTIAVVMIFFVGFVEELLFRGVLQRALATRIGRWPALVLASVLFGLMHSGYGVPAELVFAGTIGFVFGLVYDWTDSIVLISVMHGVLNIFLFGVIPLNGGIGSIL